MQSDFQRYWHGDQAEPGFLIEWREPESRRRHRIAALGAVAWHVALILFILNAPSGAGHSDERWRIELALRNATPLVEPRLDPKEFKLTQKEPQVNQPAEQVDLASLLRAARRAAAAEANRATNGSAAYRRSGAGQPGGAEASVAAADAATAAAATEE